MELDMDTYMDESCYNMIADCWELSRTARQTHAICLMNGHSVDIGDVIDTFVDLRKCQQDMVSIFAH